MRYRDAIVLAAAAALATACAQTPEMQVVNAAAEALGGASRIRAVGALTIEGGGTNPNVGQNLTPDAELNVWRVTEHTRTIDPAFGRMRLQQVRTAQFPFEPEAHQDRNRG